MADKPRMPYNTARWQKLRAAFLATSPLCVFCQREGRITPATIADHIEPHRGDLGKFWHGRLQGLCKQHHDSDKQRIERGGKARVTIGEDGWPTG